MEEPGEEEEAGGIDTLRLKVHQGEGLEELRRALVDLVYGGLVSAVGEVPLLTRRRQARGMERALEEVRAFADGLRAGLPPEVAAAHIGTSETALEGVLGVVTREDVLDRVFREFCVGK